MMRASARPSANQQASSEPFLAATLGIQGVAHGFSRALVDDADHAAFQRAIGLRDSNIARLKQVHGKDVVHVDRALAAAPRCHGDALIVDRPGVAIGVATADCVPVLLADVEAGVVAAVHAGWRGLCARILPRTVESMVARGAQPARMRAAIGPAIGTDCYEVGPEVRAEFEAAFTDAADLFQQGRLDLHRAACAELARAGLTSTAFEALDVCTRCDETLSSHRRQGKTRGTNLSVIALLA